MARLRDDRRVVGTTQETRSRTSGRGNPWNEGNTVPTPEQIRLLDETRDLVDLGFGRRHWMWDLPRTVCGKAFALPRRTVVDVGGFHPAFRGWGCEESHLAALAIASGLLVVPLRCLTGYHLGNPTPPPRYVRNSGRGRETWVNIGGCSTNRWKLAEPRVSPSRSTGRWRARRRKNLGRYWFRADA